MKGRFLFSFLIILSLFLIGIVACDKERDEPTTKIEKKHTLVGTWKIMGFNNAATSFDKTSFLMKDEFGYIFRPGGKLIIRGSAGISDTTSAFKDYEGTWSVANGILTINSSYWGGKLMEKWVIVYLSGSTFTAKKIAAEFPE